MSREPGFAGQATVHAFWIEVGPTRVGEGTDQADGVRFTLRDDTRFDRREVLRTEAGRRGSPRILHRGTRCR